MSEGDEPAVYHELTRPSLLPAKGASLPDPSQFPDPYPLRSLHSHLSSTPPALSSGGSSTASNRSSAYTSNGSALASSDYGNQVHVASPEEDEGIGVGITSDDVVQLLVHDQPNVSSGSQSRVPIDQTRWSQSYSASLRSRSSLIRTNTESTHENGSPALEQKPSYDLSWQALDERDEVDLTSGDELEDTDLEVGDAEEDVEENREEERTSAIVIVEEGRGLIVQGDGISTSQLQIQPGMFIVIDVSSTPLC